MLVLKFKGAVLQNQEVLSDIKKMVARQHCPCILVVSALKGVVPRLRKLYSLSLRKGDGFEEEFQQLKKEHEQLAQGLLKGEKLQAYQKELQQQLEDIYTILHSVAVLKESSHYMKDYILSKGDILASLLFSQIFDGASWHDSRNFILTDSNFGAPQILWEESCEAAREEFKDLQGVAVVPGYCGKTKAGDTISLGRVGLSLTASVLEAVFQQLKVA